MNEPASPPLEPVKSKKTITFVTISYVLSLVPFVTWLAWPFVLGDTTGAEYRTTFGIMLGLPLIALVLSVIGLVRYKRFVKIALLPAVLFALIVAVICYTVSISTVGQ